MEFLFRPRSSGKRQVKPSQDIALLGDQLAGDDSSSDDSEFKVGKDEDDDNSDVSDSSNSSTSTSDDEAANELPALSAELSTNELLRQARGIPEVELKSDVKVCGCCLGQSSNDANEIVECDGCGISVHEGCYGVSENASVSSEISAASTEPWFCEPCRAGLRTAPSCELCPAVGGVYKQTDVGRWVHLVCALYINGVAFGEPDSLSHVTIFEMSYANWGRRQCALCDDARFARSGVCIQCDAGMCKSYFHATCAQANGLLTEPSFHESDPYLAHCKIHTDKSVIKKRKQSYLTHLLLTKRRLELITTRHAETKLTGVKREPNENEDQRILRKLSRHQSSYRRDRLKRHEAWVPTQKMPRMLTTSASAVRKLQRMGEIKGISVERQRLEEAQALSVMEAKKKWNVAPTFAVEYVAYYHDRHERIEEFKKGLSEQLKLKSSLREKETTLRPRFDLKSRLNENSKEKNGDVRKKVQLYRNLISKICPSNAPPELLALKPIVKPIEIITPNVKAKATVWSNGSGGGHDASSQMALKTCGICQRTKDQHLLVHCDTCLLYYHLGCLTPPLTRMPKKSKLYGWQCSECDKDSSSDEAVSVDDSAPRKMRQAAARMLAASAASRNNSGHDDDVRGWTSWEKGKKKAVKNETEDETQRRMLIANASAAALKEEKRRGRKLEKEKRGAGGKKRRKEKKLMRKMDDGDDDDEVDDDDDDCEIIEQENGQVIVNIKPKSIKLKIRTPQQQQEEAASSAPLHSSNGLPSNHESGENKVQRPRDVEGDLVRSPPKKRKRRSATDRDVRTWCDKCQTDGTNDNLVRCDQCRKCYHFECLMPAVKKSPKVAGYGWHCTECDPEYDSDWHLD